MKIPANLKQNLYAIFNKEKINLASAHFDYI